MSWEADLYALIEARTGINFGDRQMQSGVHRLVDARMGALKIPSPAAYVEHLYGETTTGPEFTRLIQVITVGYSYFFRDPAQIDLLIKLCSKMARHSQGRPIHIWSACCATGEEPYTLAMRCAAAGISVKILATDMNPDFVRMAAKGSYSKNALNHVPAEFRRFFIEKEERYSIVDEVRKAVAFERHNLLWSGPSPRPAGAVGWDLILCRNAYIYFSPGARREATARFGGVLGKDGWLFLGASETLTGTETRLVPEVRSGRVGYRQPRRKNRPVLITPVPTPKRKIPTKRRKPERSAVDKAMVVGHERLARHDFDGALEAYVEAQRHSPLRADIHYASGVVYRKAGDLERALMSLRRALFLQPDYWPASFLIAGVYDRMGRSDQRRRALSQTRTALESMPTIISTSPTAGAEAFELDPKIVLAQCVRMLEA